jgi:hypothetical protein
VVCGFARLIAIPIGVSGGGEPLPGRGQEAIPVAVLLNRAEFRPIELASHQDDGVVRDTHTFARDVVGILKSASAFKCPDSLMNGTLGVRDRHVPSLKRWRRRSYFGFRPWATWVAGYGIPAEDERQNDASDNYDDDAHDDLYRRFFNPLAK